MSYISDSSASFLHLATNKKIQTVARTFYLSNMAVCQTDNPLTQIFSYLNQIQIQQHSPLHVSMTSLPKYFSPHHQAMP